MKKISAIGIITAILITMICAASYGAYTLAEPQVDREAAESSFLDAYDFFIKNRVWNCIDKLKESQEHNVYFVDTYYMRALAMRRLGRYPEAIAEMASYLEVRRTDPRATIIHNTMNEEWEIVRNELNPTEVDTGYFFTSHTIKSFLNIPAYSPLLLRGMQGLGKMSSTGELLMLCDTYGNKLWCFPLGGNGTPIELEAELPVKALPFAPGEVLLFHKNGGISRVGFSDSDRSAELSAVAEIEANVSDAAFVDSTLIAVADRTGEAVRFYGFPSLGETAEWRPADSGTADKLFEPVALATYGPFIAIADRGNGRVYIVDSYTLSERGRFDVPVPRDLAWGNQGDLYVLSENGTLYSKQIMKMDFDGVPTVVAEGMDDAWCMSWTVKGPVITDITARTWWNSGINPGRKDTIGAMTIYNPWLEDNMGTETLMMKVKASSVYHNFIQGKLPDTQAVWRNEVRPSRVLQVTSSGGGVTLFYSPSAGDAGMTAMITRAATLSDVMADIARLSRAGTEIPRVIVLDTRITASDEELAIFLAFLLQQGIRLDLWAITRPSPPILTHISRITLGNTYYSRTLNAVRPNNSYEWTLSIPLPPDTYTFGYPSESTLSVFATIDVIRFTDWMPIWPSLLKKN